MFARAIFPSHTLGDGDTVFALRDTIVSRMDAARPTIGARSWRRHGRQVANVVASSRSSLSRHPLATGRRNPDSVAIVKKQ